MPKLGEVELWLRRTVVLVVDDFPPMLTIMRHLLAEIGIQDVDCAASVSEAHSRVGARDYDVLLLDYHLADETADDLLRHLAHVPPVIFVTTDPEIEDQLRSRAPTLRPPFGARELLRSIVDALVR